MTERRRPLYRGRAGLSEREYAAHAGISRGAVQKARASGRLVLHADGSIDAAASDVRRTQATDPSMQRGRRQPSLRPVPEAAVGAVSETLREQGLPAPAAAGGMTYLQARTANEVLKAQERKHAPAEAEGRAGRPRPRRRPGVPPGAPGARRLGRLAGAGGGDDGRRSRHRRARHADGLWKPMSGSTWESSPTFAPSSGNELVDDRPQVELGFDGAEDLLRAWCDGLTPDPDLTVSAWADKHRVLSSRGASEAGPWRTSRTPYLREIMDALSPSHPCQRVAFMKGSQVGATESGGNWIGYVIHHAPGPMLAVQPSVELAKRFSQQRIDPLIEESPVLSAEGGAGPIQRLRQHGAVEGVPRRHPGDDRRQQCRRPALDAGALPVPRRGRRLSAVGRRRGRSGGPRRSPDADLLLAAQGVPRLDADHQGAVADRAGIRGIGSAAVLRALPALRREAVAQVRAAALAEGPAGNRGLSLRGLRAADRRASQDTDAEPGRVAADDDLGRSADHRLSPVEPL